LLPNSPLILLSDLVDRKFATEKCSERLLEITASTEGGLVVTVWSVSVMHWAAGRSGTTLDPTSVIMGAVQKSVLLKHGHGLGGSWISSVGVALRCAHGTCRHLSSSWINLYEGATPMASSIFLSRWTAFHPPLPSLCQCRAFRFGTGPPLASRPCGCVMLFHALYRSVVM
jgi:hypothetical protein